MSRMSCLFARCACSHVVHVVLVVHVVPVVHVVHVRMSGMFARRACRACRAFRAAWHYLVVNLQACVFLNTSLQLDNQTVPLTTTGTVVVVAVVLVVCTKASR